MLPDLQNLRISAHRNNLVRYQKILGSGLTELEKQFVERRIAEEANAIEGLVRTGAQHDAFRSADALANL